MNIKATLAILVITLATAKPMGASAEEYVVGQKNKKFTVDELEVKLGDSVRFTNEDKFHHNVFSLSDAATFDLGSYDQGESKVIQFDEPGDVEVECAIHPRMRMLIKVK